MPTTALITRRALLRVPPPAAPSPCWHGGALQPVLLRFQRDGLQTGCVVARSRWIVAVVGVMCAAMIHVPSASADPPPVSPQARAAGLVDVRTVVPDAVIDLRYATADNFVGEQLYPTDARCLVHESMAPGLASRRISYERRAIRLSSGTATARMTSRCGCSGNCRTRIGLRGLLITRAATSRDGRST
ncbi:MAG: D-alanyl-D-alanine dipeptidase [Mycobacterium sp.]|nr:D-alanyl-D-alanine dipeptidase [Mycobacterium sp.]